MHAYTPTTDKRGFRVGVANRVFFFTNNQTSCTCRTVPWYFLWWLFLNSGCSEHIANSKTLALENKPTKPTRSWSLSWFWPKNQACEGLAADLSHLYNTTRYSTTNGRGETISSWRALRTLPLSKSTPRTISQELFQSSRKRSMP